MSKRVLIVNPGSTSTKLAISDDGEIRSREVIRHTADEFLSTGIRDQIPLRLAACEAWVHQEDRAFDAIASLGGLFRPVEGGVYRVNARMIADAKAAERGAHASNLGCAMADALARQFGCEAFIVDPVSVDEMADVARISGHPLIERRSLSHALSLHGAARWAERALGITDGEGRIVVAHLGGGISIAPVKRSRIIDVNDAASDGPFSPERTGGLPLQPFITHAITQNCDEQHLRSMVMGRGGLVAYLGTTSAEEVERRIQQGDEYAKGIYAAMAYQIAKEIGAMSTVLSGRVDAIVLTGGLAHSKMLTGWIEERVSFIAPVMVRPGELEMELIAQYVHDVLTGQRKAKEY